MYRRLIWQPPGAILRKSMWKNWRGTRRQDFESPQAVRQEDSDRTPAAEAVLAFFYLSKLAGDSIIR
jgi:hypothetical protein